jgi:Leucine-rich repeat (LRR) protein
MTSSSSSSPMLTREHLETITGNKKLEQLEHLEVLFLAIDELGALNYCKNLKSLGCIDNALFSISNLSPVAMTSLTIVDQNIREMRNMQLPHLRELFLHRNKITEIDRLDGCPRLRKLWLFQTKITSIFGLHACPELQECWLQSNNIESLHGIESATEVY